MKNSVFKLLLLVSVITVSVAVSCSAAHAKTSVPPPTTDPSHGGSGSSSGGGGSAGGGGENDDGSNDGDIADYAAALAEVAALHAEAEQEIADEQAVTLTEMTQLKYNLAERECCKHTIGCSWVRSDGTACNGPFSFANPDCSCTCDDPAMLEIQDICIEGYMDL